MLRRIHLSFVLVALVAVVSSACRAKPAPEQRQEYVSGCVSKDYTFLDLLDACTREDGSKFMLLDGVESDLARRTFTEISCFVPIGTKASDIELWANIELVQHSLLRSRAKEDLDLMIDREPLPGTNTYRIYRLPRDAPSPWSSSVNGR